MAALIWGAWGAEWAQQKKVAFNGVARTITVNEDVTALDLQADVWSRWVDWAALPGNDFHTLAMRKSGYDAIPGGRSGLIYFLRNGWKLIVDLNRVRVSGVLYSDDYETSYWSRDGQPIYPATVSALVNTATTVQTVVGGTALTPEQTAQAVWQAATRTLTSGLENLDVAVSTRVATADARLNYLDAPVSAGGSGSGGISPEQYDALMAAINSKSTLTLSEVQSAESSGNAVVTEILTADVTTDMPLTGS